jgi:hypothetical protein
VKKRVLAFLCRFLLYFLFSHVMFAFKSIVHRKVKPHETNEEKGQKYRYRARLNYSVRLLQGKYSKV